MHAALSDYGFINDSKEAIIVYEYFKVKRNR